MWYARSPRSRSSGSADGSTPRSGSAVEHFVQEAVARIVVVVAVAAESQLLVEIGVEHRDARVQARAATALQTSGRRLAHALEPAHVRLRIEHRVFDARDRERRRG